MGSRVGPRREAGALYFILHFRREAGALYFVLHSQQRGWRGAHLHLVRRIDNVDDQHVVHALPADERVEVEGGNEHRRSADSVDVEAARVNDDEDL